MTTHDPTIHDGPRQPHITTPAGRPRGEPAVWLLPLNVPDVAALAASAHTLAETGASTRILDGLGLTASESVEDSEDGSIWRWTIDVRGAL